MAKFQGTAGTLVCSLCHRDEFDLPAQRGQDPLVICACGNVLGLLKAVMAKAEGAQPSTPVRAELKK